MCTHVYVCVIWSQSTFYTSSTVHVEYESFADDISQHENVATLIPLLSNVEILDVVCLVRIVFSFPLFTSFGNLIFMEGGAGEREERRMKNESYPCFPTGLFDRKQWKIV